MKLAFGKKKGKMKKKNRLSLEYCQDMSMLHKTAFFFKCLSLKLKHNKDFETLGFIIFFTPPCTFGGNSSRSEPSPFGCRTTEKRLYKSNSAFCVPHTYSVR